MNKNFLKQKSQRISLNDDDFYLCIMDRYKTNSSSFISSPLFIFFENLNNLYVVQGEQKFKRKVVYKEPLNIILTFLLERFQTTNKLDESIDSGRKKMLVDKMLSKRKNSVLNTDSDFFSIQKQSKFKKKMLVSSYKAPMKEESIYLNQKMDMLGMKTFAHISISNGIHRLKGIISFGLPFSITEVTGFQTEFFQDVLKRNKPLERLMNTNKIQENKKLGRLMSTNKNFSPMELTKFQKEKNYIAIQENKKLGRLVNTNKNFSPIELIKFKKENIHTIIQENNQLRRYKNIEIDSPTMEFPKQEVGISKTANQKEKNEKLETSSPYDFISNSVFDMNRLTDQVYQAIERKIRIERERSGR
ncbi:hypothetical protein EXW29_09570 [Bacillus toyonensis]|uniref:hypothetical protein n=1 Tax=Bacillus toyonensis TaxID=155322 RepID=UPI001C02D56E|nr:hypothetical protein [Bacillus toyonensis]QWH88422.1 hypothetical protein EXW29_09570 [Bacillus toyonensis]QWI31597.1 hypothetical protein EXW25_09560 [Bacillus toyonensis]